MMDNRATRIKKFEELLDQRLNPTATPVAGEAQTSPHGESPRPVVIYRQEQAPAQTDSESFLKLYLLSQLAPNITQQIPSADQALQLADRHTDIVDTIAPKAEQSAPNTEAKKRFTPRRIAVTALVASLVVGGGTAGYIFRDKAEAPLVMLDQAVNGDGSDVTLQTVDCATPVAHVGIDTSGEVLWNIQVASAEEVAKKEADANYQLKTNAATVNPFISRPLDENAPDGAKSAPSHPKAFLVNEIPVILCDADKTAVAMRTDTTAEVDLSKISLSTAFPEPGMPGAPEGATDYTETLGGKPFNINPNVPRLFTTAEQQRVEALINEGDGTPTPGNTIVRNALKYESLRQLDGDEGQALRVIAKAAITDYLAAQAEGQTEEFSVKFKGDFIPLHETYQQGVTKEAIESKDFELRNITGSYTVEPIKEQGE